MSAKQAAVPAPCVPATPERWQRHPTWRGNSSPQLRSNLAAPHHQRPASPSDYCWGFSTAAQLLGFNLPAVPQISCSPLKSSSSSCWQISDPSFSMLRVSPAQTLWDHVKEQILTQATSQMNIMNEVFRWAKETRDKKPHLWLHLYEKLHKRQIHSIGRLVVTRGEEKGMGMT